MDVTHDNLSSWTVGVPTPSCTKEPKRNMPTKQMGRFILKLDSRAHIGNHELVNASFLSVVDKVKQLKLGHVFKIKN